MSTETLQDSQEIIYTYDAEGCRRGVTRYELEQKELRKQLKDFIDHSTLSDVDRQHLRSISADYVTICAPLPDEAIVTRRKVLSALVGDLPEADETNVTGLRRLSSSLHGPTVTIDGYPMLISDLELAYTLVPPSTEVLDRAVSDAAYFYVADRDDVIESTAYSSSIHSRVVAHAVQTREATDEDSATMDADTLTEGFSAGRNKYFGSGVLTVVNR